LERKGGPGLAYKAQADVRNNTKMKLPQRQIRSYFTFTKWKINTKQFIQTSK